MSDIREDAARPATVGHRLRRARHRWFLGRDGELDLLRSALDAPEPPFTVLHVHGPGGVGKTALLRAFADEARTAGAMTVPLDARHFEPSPPGFTAAVRAAAGLEDDEDLGVALGARGRRAVVLLDTYETAAPLDDWLRERFLPELPADSIMVLAGREPPAPAWRSEAAWRDLLQVILLRNLRPEESRAYLRAAGVPEALHERVQAFTHGHPLALSLVLDVLAQEKLQGLADFTPEHAPDVMRELLSRFVAGVPSALHRRALEVCAHARLTTEALLRAALDAGDVHDVFEWLRSLSFIEQGPYGLAPHDLARDLLDADLRWRDREQYGVHHDRIRAHVLDRIRRSTGQEQQRALLDLMFLHRSNPFTQPYWEWESFGQTYADALTPDDHEAVVAMTARHEGEESATLAAHWLDRQPDAFVALRGGDGVLLGFLAILTLNRASPEDLEADPGTGAAWAYALRHGPPRPGEEVTHLRFMIDRDLHQRASPAVNLVSVQSCRRWLTTPNLAWDFLSVTDEGYFGPLFAYLYYDRVPEADFEVGGRRLATFAHDWRRMPAEPWLDLMGRRELDVEFQPAAAVPGDQIQPLALSQDEFDQAVRRGLHDLHRADLLAANPLLHSRVVREEADAQGTPPARALAALLREAAALLAADPRDDKLLRAVDRTYLRPATTQERAAELLGLPFSTYRRHLTRGVARIVAGLWERELYGTGPSTGEQEPSSDRSGN
jgi:AAA ATPase-like protein